ncbi:Tubulin-tyrosine ligase family protein [Trichomonas vaginalis G3]|uniref:Tubulin-tyrosine ligase family protein n=1 Tax=Trichomonas vaginalis (strain ATCC PRA-98 / G3) TaxID=412133 RepID=A2D814_TRIV3|nr:positive regulation of cilium movement [Trichomonas vaginalis G3]EAY23447.1 Tubulin-tyrosine ligase family protein [Trichomonas vaginalis G3]KAI5493860.1 positive regulation of cilium movement [Trichomonas vaginalis G3]|eukprot:XP_001584433.1 Tubulin-tyrosine ligase family protein [Trichomonas vaginalis G3]
MMYEKGTLVDVRRLKCHIIVDALKDMGYEVSSGNSLAPLIWWDGYIPPEEFCTVKPNQRINKIPQMDVLCYKSTLFQALNQMQTLFPQYYNFFPETFLLPHQFSDFQKEHTHLTGKLGRGLTWIWKPRAGCCGNGIKLIQNPYAIVNDTSPAIIQRYISPFLLDGYKFDFRVYILISTLEPFTMYVYREGLARFCTKKYHPPTKDNINDKFEHITNTAINVENTEATNNFTRLLSDVLNDVRAADPKASDVWDRIKRVALLTMLSLYPQIVSQIPAAKKDPKSPHCQITPMKKYFHICGIDILLDENANPIVLELNDRPSLKVTFACEKGLKHDLICDAMKIVTVDGSPLEVENGPENGWEKVFPGECGNPLTPIFRAVQQRSLNVFGPKQRITTVHQAAQTIIYPKPVADKNKVRFLAIHPTHQ